MTRCVQPGMEAGTGRPVWRDLPAGSRTYRLPSRNPKWELSCSPGIRRRGLTLVTQSRHKEQMRIAKRNPHVSCKRGPAFDCRPTDKPCRVRKSRMEIVEASIGENQGCRQYRAAYLAAVSKDAIAVLSPESSAPMLSM